MNNALLILGLAAVIATFAKGMWYTYGEGEIFAFVGRWISPLPEALRKPLGECPRCMCGLYGVIALAWMYFVPAPYVWAIAIPCAIGLQEMIDR